MVFFGTVYSGGSSSCILGLLVMTMVGFRKVWRSWLSELWVTIRSKEEGSSNERPEDIGSNTLFASACLRLAKSLSDWLFDRKPPPREVTNFFPGANCFEEELLLYSCLVGSKRRPVVSTRVNRPGVIIRVDAWKSLCTTSSTVVFRDPGSPLNIYRYLDMSRVGVLLPTKTRGQTFSFKLDAMLFLSGSSRLRFEISVV